MSGVLSGDHCWNRKTIHSTVAFEHQYHELKALRGRTVTQDYGQEHTRQLDKELIDGKLGVKLILHVCV